MSESEFYLHYIPALLKALEEEDKWEQFNVRGPDYFLNLPVEKYREIDLYLDEMAGKSEFLDNVAYYFDAKSHGFPDVEGVKIEKFRERIQSEILKLKKKYSIE